MIKAPPIAVQDEAAHVAAEKIDDTEQLKDERAIRRLTGDDDGRHFCKWLMAMTDLEGMSGSPQREGQRSIGLLFKVLCDSVDPAIYAGLVAEAARDRVANEAIRAKAMAS